MTPRETLELAEWRRRIADLYARVRKVATHDPEAAWEDWRATRETLFREHPQSPVPAEARGAFRAWHWPYDPALRLEGVVQPDAPTETDVMAEPDVTAGPASVAASLRGLAMLVPISTGGGESLERIGTIRVPFASGERRLGLYWMSGYTGGLFLPFRDATNGNETYGAGRYLLDAAKSADLGPGRAPGSLVLDFNFAFQPSCAFDPKWACPLAPPENRLDLRIEAGERLAA
ncbi:MAG TPA: DUF1684 domain-containing protein [Candidatus Limnocylindrales bacterium]|nr:DUF1684 domain-containing protein [Candidatus Limnocylindrales bacterium]